MTKRLMALLALFGALFLAFAAPATADPNSGTTQITGAPDGGQHGDWASDNFSRYTTVTPNADGSYDVTINDNGSFTTLAGASSPRDGVTLPDTPVTGDLKGQMTFKVISEVKPNAELLPKSVNGKPNTSDWPRRLFPPDTDVTITSTGYTWLYSTKCESWKDSSDNNDGSDASAGDITGKVCPSDSPSASASPSASPSSAGAVPVASSTTTAPTLPVTGTPTGIFLAAGVAAVVIGAAGCLVAQARRRRKG